MAGDALRCTVTVLGAGLLADSSGSGLGSASAVGVVTAGAWWMRDGRRNQMTTVAPRAIATQSHAPDFEERRAPCSVAVIAVGASGVFELAGAAVGNTHSSIPCGASWV